MNVYDYIILCIIVLALAAAFVYIIKRRKSGKNFCGGDCCQCKNECIKKSPK